jgi:hypothetical protein
MTSRWITVTAIVGALVGLGGVGMRASGDGLMAMREIVHIQTISTAAGFVPAHDGTIIVEN